MERSSILHDLQDARGYERLSRCHNQMNEGSWENGNMANYLFVFEQKNQSTNTAFAIHFIDEHKITYFLLLRNCSEIFLAEKITAVQTPKLLVVDTSCFLKKQLSHSPFKV